MAKIPYLTSTWIQHNPKTKDTYARLVFDSNMMLLDGIEVDISIPKNVTSSYIAGNELLDSAKLVSMPKSGYYAEIKKDAKGKILSSIVLEITGNNSTGAPVYKMITPQQLVYEIGTSKISDKAEKTNISNLLDLIVAPDVIPDISKLKKFKLTK